jgi:hypothetical protein
MKRLCLYSIILSIAIVSVSCNEKTVGVQDVQDGLTKKEIDSLMRPFRFTVSEAYKVNGLDTINLLDDTLFVAYNNAVCLAFWETSVLFHGGHLTTNTEFAPTAKTMYINNKIPLPAGIRFEWDNAKDTYKFESNGNSSYFPIIPAGKVAYLDKSKLNLTHNFEEAKNAVIKPSITFDYDDYIVVMKPMWYYKEDPGNTAFQYLVAF